MTREFTFPDEATAQLFTGIWNAEQRKHFDGSTLVYLESATVKIPTEAGSPAACRFAIAITWFNATLAAVQVKPVIRRQPKRARKEREIAATMKAARWLNLGNEAAERGNQELAERHYERSQKWHDKMIDLAGEGDSQDRTDEK